MVEKLRAIVDELVNNHEKILLFAVMKMDDVVDKWSVIVSATWIKQESSREIFDEILKLLKEKLDNEELASIARIGIYDASTHLIEELLKFRAGQEIENQRINGNMIYKAHIIESNPELLKGKILA